jgi:hypothetical protein
VWSLATSRRLQAADPVADRCERNFWFWAFSAFLVTGVLEWSDCLKETSAWDTLSWFAVLVGMSAMLNQFGIVKFFADSVAATLTAWQLSMWQVRETRAPAEKTNEALGRRAAACRRSVRPALCVTAR